MITQAIFLSYASQDADAARRLCDALRAAGLEVWFDQSELRGGDAWDASIRKQIKECALFVPIISTNTNAREEGYFRLEWKLAVDRSHLMADDKAFFFPVVLGDVAEPTARVPEKFRERQWSRLNDEVATKAFAAQIAKLAGGSASSSKNASSTPSIVAIAPQAAATADKTPSIAVLAFANRSASADDEYFSDGLADELLNVLAKIKGLRVAARTSAFSFKGKQTTVAEIGRILNVATVLEGSVRKSGNRVRISVQLVKVDDGFQMWGETYDRTLDDIFAVQDDIAQSVVSELRSTLLGERPSPPENIAAEIAQATTARSESPEAQRLLLQARFYREKRRPADLERAIALSEQAIALDPHYAAAHASLADDLHGMSFYGASFGSDAHTMLTYSARARASAEKALSLDATLLLPHITLSWLAAVVDRDLSDAMRQAKLAVALAPNDAEALRTLAHRLVDEGQFAEADALYERAIILNPLWLHLRINYSMSAHWRGDFVEALRRVKEAFAIDESYWLVHWQLGSVLSSLGEHTGAVDCTAKLFELRGDMEMGTQLRRRFAEGGWQGYLEAMASASPNRVPRIQIAYAQVELGRHDEAFATLDAIVDNYDQFTLWLNSGVRLEPLRSDPRYAALLKRAGFAESAE